MRRESGFTLIELIMVVVLLGILSGVLSRILAGPLQGYMDSKRRAELVDIAQGAINRIIREVRQALPNSVRVGCSGGCMEFLNSKTGGRYRYGPVGDTLDFDAAPDSFEVLGGLDGFGSIRVGGTGLQSDCLNGITDCLVIYNTGQPGASAYVGDNVAAITAASATSITFDNGGVPPFPLSSPDQRFYVVDTPVSYICDVGAGTLTRYWGYPIVASQPASPGGNSALLVNRVTACSFDYDSGTARRGGLLTVRITITDSDLGQSISLLQQAHVANAP